MAAERTLIDSLAYLGDTLIIVAYHVAQTYVTPESQERYAFYDSTLYEEPFVVFNGRHLVQEESPSNYAAAFKQAAGIARTDPEYYRLVIDSVQVDSAQGSFYLTIEATFTIPSAEIACFVAVLEDSLPGAYNHTFYNVCRALYEFPIDVAYQDTFDTIITFYHSIPQDYLKVAVFIQDLDSLGIMAVKSIEFTTDTMSYNNSFLSTSPN